MLTFLREFMSHQRQTGAMLPSGRHLARVMTRDLGEDGRPKRVLEVGPGTGAFTGHILRGLRPGDEFHLVEINDTFADVIEREFLSPYRVEHPDVDIVLHRSAIEEVPLTGRFDYIICGLPFNNFPLTMVRGIFRRLFDLLREGGQLSFFEYAGVRAVKAPVMWKDKRQRLRRREAMVRALRRRHMGRRDLVLSNLPPAYAIHLFA